MHDKTQRAAALAAPVMHFDKVGCASQTSGKVIIDLHTDRVWLEDGKAQNATATSVMLATDLNGAIDLHNTLGQMIAGAVRPPVNEQT